MTIATVYAGAFVSGTWTNSANATGAPNASSATRDPARRVNEVSYWGSFNFSGIPAGATINSVTLTIRASQSGTATSDSMTFRPAISTTLLGTVTTHARTTALSDTTSASQSLTLAQLQDANFRCWVNLFKDISSANTFSIDSIWYTVDYTASGGAPVTATPTGIASGESFGLVAAALLLVVSPAGIGTGEGFGVPVHAGTVTVSPAGVSSGEAFGTPTAAHVTTVAPAGIGSGESFGTPGASTSLTATPSGIPGGEAVGTPTYSGTRTATPGGIPTAEVFGTPAASTALTAAPAGVGSGEAFGVPAASGQLTAAPAGILSGTVLGIPVASSTLTVSPSGIGTGEAFGSPSAVGLLNVSPSGIGTVEAFGTPAALTGNSAAPEGIASGEAFGTPTAGTSLTVTPQGIGSAEAFGVPVVVTAWVASPAGITSGEAFGNPANIQALTYSPAGIPSGEAFGTPAALGAVQRDVVLATGPLLDRFTTDALEGRLMSVALVGRWSLARLEGEPLKKEVLVSSGAVEYVGGVVTEATGKDISGATFMLSLGSATNPGVWVAPSISTAGDSTAERVLKLLVNGSTQRGAFYVWARITDSPEVVPVRFPQEIVIR